MNIISEIKATPRTLLNHDDLSIRVLSSNTDNSRFMQDVANITVWRNCYSNEYLTSFFSTTSRTYSWLVDYYMPSDSDLMLMFDDKDGVCFGHIAFINFTSIDGIVRCELSRVARGPGLGGAEGMKSAFALALKWCADVLGVEELSLEVFDDNTPAVKFYKYFGFIELGYKYMRKVGGDKECHWQVCDEKFQERRLFLMKKMLLSN